MRRGLKHTDSKFNSLKNNMQLEIAKSQLKESASAGDFHQISAALRRARRLVRTTPIPHLAHPCKP